MTAIRVHENRRPTYQPGPLLGMEPEQARFWRLLRKARPHLYAGKALAQQEPKP
jgi:hypothetical protein